MKNINIILIEINIIVMNIEIFLKKMKKIIFFQKDKFTLIVFVNNILIIK